MPAKTPRKPKRKRTATKPARKAPRAKARAKTKRGKRERTAKPAAAKGRAAKSRAAKPKAAKPKAAKARAAKPRAAKPRAAKARPAQTESLRPATDGLAAVAARLPTAAAAELESEAPAAVPAVALYDLVCSDEGRLQGGLEFAACMTLAEAHQNANPDHEADCIQQLPPPDDA
jgi:hypothetical protein